MTRAVTILSFATSLFLFQLGLSRLALGPILVCMYLIFTNGHLHAKPTHRQFSKYHILFGLRCSIAIGLTLLMHVFSISIIQILCVMIGLHMIAIWLLLVGDFQDEFQMFHIGYFFILVMTLRYITIQYGWHAGGLAILIAPILTFLLYACGTFFIHPFVPLPVEWHYRTALFFVISFLSSIILYFFSVQILGRTAASCLYACAARFVVSQYRRFVLHEQEKNVSAESILAGAKVIQPTPTARYGIQAYMYRTLTNLTGTRRVLVVQGLSLLFVGALVSAFIAPTAMPPVMTCTILGGLWIIHYYITDRRSAIGYPTFGSDSLMGALFHGIFIRTVRQYTGLYHTTFLFLTMAWTVIQQAISIFLGGQLRTWKSPRKGPLLYGYVVSTRGASILVSIVFTQLGLQPLFVGAIILLYLGVIGAMSYFFARALSTPPAISREA